MPEYIRLNLGEKLIESGLISPEQYEKAMTRHAETKVILRQILIDMGFITEDQLMDFMGVQLGIPVMRDLISKINNPEVFKLIPKSKCHQYKVIPLFQYEGVLTVAMADPLDVFALDDLKQITKCSIEPVYGKRKEIESAITKLYDANVPFEEIIIGMTKEAEEKENKIWVSLESYKDIYV